jgi:replicative DNA helicase
MIQLKTLYALIQDNRFEFIQDIEPQYFTDDINYEIYKSFAMEKLEGNAVSFESIKNSITTAKHKYASQMVARLSEIEQCTAYGENIIDALSSEYNNHLLNKLVTDLTNKAGTEKMKINSVKDIADKLNGSSKNNLISLNESTSKLVQDLKDGIVSSLSEHSIELKNPAMRSLFMGRIFPRPYCIGALPGFGKTRLMDNILVELDSIGKKGMVFTMEDSIDTKSVKFLAVKYMIPEKNIMHNQLTEDQRNTLEKNEITKKRINRCWVDTKHYNITEFIDVLERNTEFLGLDYVMVDYLQLFRMPTNNRHSEIGLFTKYFLEWCNKYNKPLIFLSQMDRRKGKDNDDTVELQLQDFKESGNIEQDIRFAFLIQGSKTSSEKIVNVAKESSGMGRYKKMVKFDGESGKIIGVIDHND